MAITTGICVVAFLAITIAEHVLRPGLSPASHEISEYANGRFGVVMEIGFAIWSLSLAMLGVRLLLARDGARHRRGTTALVSLLMLACIGIAITAAFHTQTSAGRLPIGVRATTAGELHNAGSGLALIALAVAAVLSVSMAGTVRWRRATLWLLAVTATSTLPLVLLGQPVAGVRQRVLVLAACCWQLLMLPALTPVCQPGASESRVTWPEPGP